MILTLNISAADTMLMHVVVADAVLIIRVPVPDFYFQIKYNIIRCNSVHQSYRRVAALSFPLS